MVAILINVTPVQNFIVGQVTKTLSQRLKTKVEIDHVRIDLLNHVLVQGVYIEGQKSDTLLYAGEIRFRITDWFIFRDGVPVIKYVGLHDAYANMYRTAKSDEWNYQFIVNAFSTGEKKKDTTSGGSFNIDLEEVDLKNIRFNMNDAWVGSDMNFEVGTFSIEADVLDLEKKVIAIDEIAATGTKVILRDYEGGRPPKPKAPTSNIIDTTPFNPDSWKISLGSIDLENCYFSTDILGTKELQNEFDPEHIRVSNINLEAKDLAINGDTLTANLKNLSAKERCGLVVKKFKAEVRVSPTESICKDLLLETNNSHLQDYYAMHYSRFPDFNDYINSVRMVAHLQKSKVDADDVAYFATVLREYPTILNISGDIDGTVANITGKNLFITDGFTTVKGNLKMDGLPDIETTYIDFRNGELFTGATGILKYAPDLKNNPNFAIETISRAHFQGNFKGYINNFVLDGTIVSSVGSIVSDLKMKLPEGKNGVTTFDGNVKVHELNLGALLREPDLGTVTLSAEVDGTETQADGIALDFKTFIEQIEYKQYPYKGINADGKFAAQKFTGNLLINDPNLSLGFYGEFDFGNNDLKIDAKANLLQSNLKALNLTPNDQINLAADFDLDWVGNNFDDFIGYAKLYNIDLTKDGRQLDIDSVYVQATENGTEKTLTVSSNALTAKVKGKYSLTTLPASFQYYLAGYLPNYISIPENDAPVQDISFHLETHDLNNLLEVFVPTLSGFNNTQIDGYLNTAQQQLQLNAEVPYGYAGGITFKNSKISASGNFNTLTLNADLANVYLADTSLNGSIKIVTSLGNDKLAFNITTESPSTIGNAILKGQAEAHGDTLDIAFLPSEFYLKGNKWEIPGGNKIVYTDGFIDVQRLYLQSGPQKISIQSNNNGLLQSLTVNISNLSVYDITNVAGLQDYNLKGTVNGSVKADNLFTEMMVNANIKATNVQFDSVQVGNMNILGDYDGKKHLITLDPSTGMYKDDKSLVVSGKLSFDSTISQNIDGLISLNHVPLGWIQPLLQGFVSDVRGTLDGKIVIKGTSTSPDVTGRVNLAAVGMHIDFLGTEYTIPEGKITVDERSISLGRMTLLDKFNNSATLSGGINHKRFTNMALDLRMTSQKFEVIDLKSYESELFYGNFIAKFESLSVTGPFDNVNVRITKAQPAQKSHLYLPLSSGGTEAGAYSYITFRNEEDTLEPVKKEENKLTIVIDAQLNPLGEITMVMDPSTGDAINAKGTGSILMTIPPNDEIRMTGNYTIEDGSYTFTLPQLFFKRKFAINNGSTITFRGPIDNTTLNVDGVYRTRTRLYDLLSPSEKQLIADLDDREVLQAKMTRDVDVILRMDGSLAEPQLSFALELPDRSGAGTIAYKKVERINNDEQALFNQVASLLLINAFMPGDGGGFEGASSSAGVVSNIGDIFSGTASSQLTNLLGKLTGDDDIAVNLKYQQYSLTDNTSSTGTNRNAVSIGVSKNLFKNKLGDRLSVEVGSSVDWGKPTANSNASNFNPVGDFRLQYQFIEGGALRGNIFRTSSYDVLAERDITRGGVGLSWRKSFNSIPEFFRGSKYMRREEEENQNNTDSTSSQGTQ